MTAVDLSTFLLARLDEDEQLAKAAARQHEAAVAAFKVGRPSDMEDVPEENAARWSGGSDESCSGHWRQAVWAGDGIATICEMSDEYDSASPEHIARHDPARVLTEVQAKQAIVAAWQSWGDNPSGEMRDYGHQEGLEQAIEHLATVYADHPDYRDEWKP